MFCPACGTQLPESAKFCLECGVKLSTFAPGIHPEAAANKTAPIGSAAVAASPTVTDPSAGPAFASTAPAASNAVSGSGTLHGTGGASAAAPAAVRPSRTGTTAHGAQVFVDPGDDSVQVPMTGPSRKSLVAGALGIAVVSLAIGAVGAWRAVKASRTQTTQAPPLPEPENAVALLEAPHSLPRANDPAQPRGASGGRANGGRNSSANGGAAVAQPGGSNGGGGAANGAGGGAANGAGGGAPSGAANGAASAGSGSSGSGASQGASGTQASAGTTGGTRPSNTGSSGTASSGSSGSSGNTTSNGASGGTGNTASAGGSSGSGGAGIEGSGISGPRAPAQSGYVEGEATDATGTLDPAAFTFVYRHFRTQISSCHSSVTRGGQVVAGIMRVRVRIGTDGRVVRTSIAENTTNNTALATCVQNQIRTWRYPSPEGGEVEMEYRLGFGN